MKLADRSLKIKIEDILEVEDEAMNMIRDVSYINGFSLNLWHNGIDTKIIDSFIKKYSKNIRININENQLPFFCIESGYPENHRYRYKYIGGVIDGIKQYKNLINHILKKENNWN